MLEGQQRFILVFDGIDKQREASPMLLAALARFGEIVSLPYTYCSTFIADKQKIPNLSVILTLLVAKPHLLHSPGIPHLQFPPYTRDESLRIINLDPRNIFTKDQLKENDYSEQEVNEDNVWLWNRFTAIVWDSLSKSAARDIIQFGAVCDKLWHPFVSSIQDGTFGTRDFARLMVAKRTLFQTEDVLIDKVVERPAAGTKQTVNHSLRDMPYYSKYILCAAYLASFNPARQDQIYFMKMHEKKRRKRAMGSTAGRQAKHRRIPRHLLNASPFPLDRLLAILHAILPEALSQTADIQTQIATLTALRLLQRVGASSDPLDPACKWRVNFGWDYAQAVGRSVGFEIGEWVARGAE